MPNRILRDWTDSEAVDLLSVFAERFFIRLIMKVDDYGRYSANVKLLKSTLFPLKTDVRETDIARWIAECEKSGLIALYCVASKEYVQILNFKQTLRQKTQKYPSPENGELMHSIRLADDEQTHSRRMVETKGNETKGNEEPPPDFAQELKGDEPFYEQAAINWRIDTEAYFRMIDGFQHFLLSKHKEHPDYGEYKSHFFNWGGKKYREYQPKKKQMVE
jgi:hypothetical protein